MSTNKEIKPEKSETEKQDERKRTKLEKEREEMIERRKQMEERSNKLDKEREEMIEKRKQMENERDKKKEKRDKKKEELKQMQRKLFIFDLGSESLLKLFKNEKDKEKQNTIGEMIFLVGDIQEQNEQIKEQNLQIEKQDQQIEKQMNKSKNKMNNQRTKQTDRQTKYHGKKNNLALFHSKTIQKGFDKLKTIVEQYLDSTQKQKNKQTFEEDDLINKFNETNLRVINTKFNEDSIPFVNREEEMEEIINGIISDFLEVEDQTLGKKITNLTWFGSSGIGKTRLAKSIFFQPKFKKKFKQTLMEYQNEENSENLNECYQNFLKYHLFFLYKFSRTCFEKLGNK
ncbi:disease resistance protein rp [Anaeramoeba flamelloides]|uniref:Disease resistance protein rp n=1 Tax=Anaeramoeba flamelloides TaxID=1746091 RepID=A0AAV8A4I5_9EUKA|nr:disease resistance protein rp [Anaeramoeba flamelloides]